MGRMSASEIKRDNPQLAENYSQSSYKAKLLQYFL